MKFQYVLLLCFVTNSMCHDTLYSITLTQKNFDKELLKNNHFIMFFAPWCGHCQKFLPTWDQLAEMLNEDDTNLKIANVDCTKESELCVKHDITGYPTLKFFRKGSQEGQKFRGTRDMPTLTSYINDQLRESDTPVEINPPEVTTNLYELTEANFHEHIKKGKHFIEFYAPWCGHCQKLAPVWEELAKFLEDKRDKVSIGKVDCTLYRPLCNDFDIKGYPTLLWIENSKKKEKYMGDRNLDDLKEYVNRMLGDKKVKSELKQPANSDQGPTVVMNNETFTSIINQGVTLVQFFAPWCGHCKRLAPIWDDLCKKFQKSKDIIIAKVDCTDDSSKDICTEQEVESFPTIVLYRQGYKVAVYTGNRSLDDLSNFVKKNVGHDEL